MAEEPRDSSQEFEKALEETSVQKYRLQLFIAGNNEKSASTLSRIREICETRLKGRYTLEVIDIYQQPEMAREAQVVATPTLIKQLPLPLRRIIGNLTSIDRILVGLNLVPLNDMGSQAED